MPSLTSHPIHPPQVLGWRALPGGGARVTTDTGDYEAEALVLAAGAWMPKLVPELEVRGRVLHFVCVGGGSGG